MHVPTHRQAPRRHTPLRAAVFTLLGLLAAACGSPEEPTSAAGPESQEVLLQPVASAGPDPFTATSATAESAPAQPPLPNPTGQGVRTVKADTPGLYGGTRRLGSCDVEQQLRALTEDDAKAKAFAQAVSVEPAKLPEFLRGLTPVVLRADTRVTNHAFRDGRADAFQSVLQAGTAVLVDDHGMPRVRCACGNPLQAPRAPKGSALKGDQWNGYQPHQVIVVEPAQHAIKSLVIVNIADNTWLERKTGDDGAQDRTPQPVPAYDPAEGIPVGPVTPPGAASAEPCAPPETNDGAGAGANGLARTAPPAPPKPPSGPAGVPAPRPRTACRRRASSRPNPPSRPSPASPRRRPRSGSGPRSRPHLRAPTRPGTSRATYPREPPPTPWTPWPTRSPTFRRTCPRRARPTRGTSRNPTARCRCRATRATRSPRTTRAPRTTRSAPRTGAGPTRTPSPRWGAPDRPVCHGGPVPTTVSLPDDWPAHPDRSLSLNRMGSFDWDLETGLMHLDAAALDVFDTTPDAYDGRPESLSPRVPPAEQTRLDALVSSALKSGEDSYGAYFRIRCKDGRLRWTHTQGRVMRGPDGRPFRIIGIVRDATEELSHSAERLGLDEERRRQTSVVESTTAALAHARTVRDVIDVIGDAHGLERLGSMGMVMGLVEAGRIHLVAEGPRTVSSPAPGTPGSTSSTR